MGLVKRLAALAAVAEVARRFAHKNPDKASQLVDSAAAFLDKQTKGKYSAQIRSVADRAKSVAGIRPTVPGPGSSPSHPTP